MRCRVHPWVWSAALLVACHSEVAPPGDLAPSPVVLTAAGAAAPRILSPRGLLVSPTPPIVILALFASEPLEYRLWIDGVEVRRGTLRQRILPWPLPTGLRPGQSVQLWVEGVLGSDSAGARRVTSRDELEIARDAVPPGDDSVLGWEQPR